MRLPFWCSGCDDVGAHSYFGPPRRPDEVLEALRRSEPCGMGRSFWGSRHMTQAEGANLRAGSAGIRAADLGGDGERRRRGAAATGRAADLGGDGGRRRRGGRLTLAAMGSGGDGEGGGG